jgi:hypothetical protein
MQEQFAADRQGRRECRKCRSNLRPAAPWHVRTDTLILEMPRKMRDGDIGATEERQELSERADELRRRG